MSKVQPITFQGKFVKTNKFKGKSAAFVYDVMNKKIDDISNKDLLEKLPFDVEISRKQNSHKAIHPKIVFDIDYKMFWGRQSYYVEHGADDAILNMRKWFENFVKFMEKNKDKTKLTPKEENDRIFNYIRGFGQVKRYKPLQRH